MWESDVVPALGVLTRGCTHQGRMSDNPGYGRGRIEDRSSSMRRGGGRVALREDPGSLRSEVAA